MEQNLGNWTKAVYAAGLTAQKLHDGQLDKGGNDYFTSHLLKVGLSGENWKEQIVGFLHDATEDTPFTLDEVMKMVYEIHQKIDSLPEKDWWQEWMKDVLPCYGAETFFIDNKNENDIREALMVLNHHNSSSREEYLVKISRNTLATKVKLNDLRSNMDISRIPQPTEKDLLRLARYRKEYDFLLSTLP